MARPRAIYRGKRKYGWIITVVLFLLIIAFMVGMWVFYDMQKYIRYEKDGLYLDLTEGEGQPDEDDEDDESEFDQDCISDLDDEDAEDGKHKGIFGFFQKKKNDLESLKARYSKAETNVDKICTVLENHQVQLLKDIAMLDKMYEKNLGNYKELGMYILAGKKKLQNVREQVLPEMIEKAKQTGDAADSQAANDMAAFCDRFEKKIHDLELTRAISIQTAPQIRMIQNNDNVMVEKIQTTLMNTIPLWKNQMVLSLGIAHSSEAAAAQKQVNDITNALLKQNAERLHLASVETAKEAERGIVDIETLKATNAKLIQTFDDVMKIQADGRAKRLAAETEMLKMENDLKQKLLQIRSGN